MENVMVIGFMGTGKSTVGRALAERFGLTRIDMDEEIVSRVGCSIAELMRDKGEQYFRDVESRVLHDLCKEKGLVITTGGGVVLREENRQLLQAHGLVIALDASEEEIVRRVQRDPDRPLLAGNVAERVHQLKLERAGLYDFAPIQIDTTGKPIEQIVEEICEQMDKITSSRGN
ncbi:MAG: shikimate kinase [Clostridia bacterium]